MLLRHLRNVLLAQPQSTQQFKNKLSHIVRSISVNMSEQQQQQVNGNGVSATATTATTNGNGSATSDLNPADLIKFMELVGNLKVSASAGGG